MSNIANIDVSAFHLFEVVETNDDNYNGYFKKINTITSRDLLSVKATKSRYDGGEIIIKVPIFDTMEGGEFVDDYSDALVPHKDGLWQEIIENQIFAPKGSKKFYFITSTKAVGQDNTFKDDITMSSIRRRINGSAWSSDLTTETGFVPHYHGWLTGLEQGSDNEWEFTFSDINAFFKKMAPDNNYINDAILTERSVRQNHVSYTLGSDISFIFHMERMVTAALQKSTVRNGYGLYYQANLNNSSTPIIRDWSNRKRDEFIKTVGFTDAMISSRRNFPTANDYFDIIKYEINSLDLITKFADIFGVVKNPNICLKSAGDGNVDHYHLIFDFWYPQYTKSVTMNLYDFDIKYDVLASDYYSHISCVESGVDTTETSDTTVHKYWSYGHAGDKRVVPMSTTKVIQKGLDGDSVTSESRAMGFMKAEAESEFESIKNNYLTLTYSPSDDLGELEIGDIILVSVDYLSTPVSMIIDSKGYLFDPDTCTDEFIYTTTILED